MSQEFWAGLIVAAAALYLVWRWLPARWRRHLGARTPESAGACGSCSACGGCASGAVQAGSGGSPTLARARWQPSLPSSNSRHGEGRHS